MVLYTSVGGQIGATDSQCHNDRKRATHHEEAPPPGGLAAAAYRADRRRCLPGVRRRPGRKATGSVTWEYQGHRRQRRPPAASCSTRRQDRGTLDYTDSTGQTIHGVVAVGSVEKTANTVTFHGTITDSNYSPNLNDPFHRRGHRRQHVRPATAT